MKREHKILFLVDDDIEYVMKTLDGKAFLRSVLMRGFYGYDNLSESELEEEYQSRAVKV